MATIGLVERWLDEGTPTPAARLAEVEALAALGLLDRAWARLEALPEADAPKVARLRLLARLLARREGGPRARAALEALRQVAPKDPHIRDIEAALDRPAAPPDLPPADAPLDAQLHAASELLAAGAHVRARRFVQSLAERFGPVPPVVEMVRAVHGDFGLDDRETRRLLEQHGLPALQPAPFEDDLDLTGTEATQITRFAEPEAAADAELAESTQVLRVLGAETSGAWTPPAVDTPDLEEEDDGVVLVARRPSTPPTTRRPLPSPVDDAGPSVVDIDVDALEALDAAVEIEPLDAAPQPPAEPTAAGATTALLLGIGAVAVLVAAGALAALVWALG